MRDWRTIKKAIEDALTHFSVIVTYIPPMGKGNDAQCSEFLVTVLDNSEEFFDVIVGALSSVCNTYGLSLYEEFPKIHLYAHWDLKKQ